MSKKKLYNKGGIVYSTSRRFQFFNEEEPEEFLPPKKNRNYRFSIKNNGAEKLFH